MPCSKPVLSNAAEFPLQLDGCSVKVVVNDLLVYELIREWRKETGAWRKSDMRHTVYFSSISAKDTLHFCFDISMNAGLASDTLQSRI